MSDPGQQNRVPRWAGALDALDAFNRRHPWSHNDAFSGLVLWQARKSLREGATSALDVGCGTGSLLCRLGELFPLAVGIEADRGMAALARDAVVQCPTVEVMNEVFPADWKRYDFVSMVAVLHHLPLVPGIEAARAVVAPGGRLVIVGLYREQPTDKMLSVLSLVLNPIVGLVRHPGRAEQSPPNMSAPTVAAQDSYEQIREALRVGLPGVTVHRALFWRYVAIWRSPR